MAWLRPILLLAGALFIALLVWWESRRPGPMAGFGATRVARNEPSLDPPVNAGAEQGAQLRAGLARQERTEEGDGRGREQQRAPPVISWSDVAPADHHALVQPVGGAGGGAAAGPAPELIVDWPAEHARRIVTLRILPARQDRLAGRALRQGLTACGFRHGQFGIFHLPGDDGRVVISAASLVRPGMLDPATMDFQRFAGINVFAVLPGPLSSELALQRLGQVAVDVAARVGGRVQDESSAPFSAAEALEWRRRCLTAIASANANAGRID